jgi:CspA family cold shock protein
VKAAAPEVAASVRPGEGVVARYDAERGFGFITPDAGGADLFVHMSVLGGAEPLQKGEPVRYKVRQSDRGPQADRVERVERAWPVTAPERSYSSQCPTAYWGLLTR